MLAKIADALGMAIQFIGYGIAGFILLIILAIVLGALFGEKTLWDYEAEGFSEACEKGSFEVDLECKEKKGSFVEIRGNLKTEFRNKPIEVYLNNFHLVTFSADENQSGKRFEKKFVNFSEPNAGDTVMVEIDGQEIFSSQLYKD